MALNYQIEDKIRSNSQRFKEENDNYPDNGYVIVKMDQNGVAQFERVSYAQSIENIELSPNGQALYFRVRNANVKFATNAFFFQEGHAEHFEDARYGLFRVDDKGNPL